MFSSVDRILFQTDYVVCFPQWTEFFFKLVLQICSLRFCIYMVKYNGMNYNSQSLRSACRRVNQCFLKSVNGKQGFVEQKDED